MKKILSICIVITSIFCAITMGFVMFNLLHTSASARVGEIKGIPLNVPTPGKNLIVNWTTDPMPYCDANLSYYVRNIESGGVIYVGTKFHTAWGHTNYVNGPNNSYINEYGKSVFNSVITKLPANIWVGKWAYRMEFQFYCNAWDRIFPETKSVEPFIFEIVE